VGGVDPDHGRVVIVAPSGGFAFEIAVIVHVEHIDGQDGGQGARAQDALTPLKIDAPFGFHFFQQRAQLGPRIAFDGEGARDVAARQRPLAFIKKGDDFLF
jgi:hypothetical protein